MLVHSYANLGAVVCGCCDLRSHLCIRRLTGISHNMYCSDLAVKRGFPVGMTVQS